MHSSSLLLYVEFIYRVNDIDIIYRVNVLFIQDSKKDGSRVEYCSVARHLIHFQSSRFRPLTLSNGSSLDRFPCKTDNGIAAHSFSISIKARELMPLPGIFTNLTVARGPLATVRFVKIKYPLKTECRAYMYVVMVTLMSE
jgi:hypothetical protein